DRRDSPDRSDHFAAADDRVGPAGFLDVRSADRMLGTNGGESRCDWQRVRRPRLCGASGATGGSVPGAQLVCAARARALWSRCVAAGETRSLVLVVTAKRG